MAYIGASPQTSLQQYLTIDDISGSFNGVLTSFALQVGGVAPVPGPSQSNQLLISLGGVIQEPDDTGSAGFRLSGGNIIFSSAPASSTAFFGVVLAGADYIYAGTNFPDGSVTTPSITFANDLDSGFYRTGSGELAYTSNGTFRLKIDSSGRVGVGTSSPTALLHVSGGDFEIDQNIMVRGSDTRGVFVRNGANTQWGCQLQGNGNAHFLGNVGVGTTSPNNLLELAGASIPGIRLTSSSGPHSTLESNTVGSISIAADAGNTGASTNINFRIDNSEKVRIDSSGRVGIGTSSPAQRLHLGSTSIASGTANWAQIQTNGNNMYVGIGTNDAAYIQANGELRFATGSYVDRMTINSSGNVGIGQTDPQNQLSMGTTGSFHTDANSFYLGSNFTGSGQNYIASSKHAQRLFFNNASSNGYLSYSNTGGTGTAGSAITWQERFRVDSSGRLLVGTSSARTDFATTPQVQVEGSDSSTSSFSLTRNSNDTGRPTFFFGKSRGTTDGSTNVVSNGDGLGTIEWAGGDGDQLVRAAYIAAFVDGTPGNNDMPGRLSFWTTADGAGSPTEQPLASSKFTNCRTQSGFSLSVTRAPG